MKIGIVGAGVSGLVAAHYLQRDHEVVLFESADYAGGHTHTVDVMLDGIEYPVDTGFIVFNEHNYPNFTRLLEELGIASQPSSMGFSFKSENPDFEYMGASLDTIFAQRRNLLRPRFYRMLRDILRFNEHAPACLRSESNMTLGQLLDDGGYSTLFVERYLLAMGAAIWSAPMDKMRDFPARAFVQFFINHGLLKVKDRPQWRTVTGGARRYVEAILAGFRGELRLRTPVLRVNRQPGQVQIATADGVERFDSVIFACHSDQALKLLGDPSAAEAEILGAMPYQGNEAVLHTDTSLLPKRRRAWAAWNYLSRSDVIERVAVTYNLNILQDLPFHQQCLVTLNANHAIRPETIIKKMTYDHPLFSAESFAAQSRRLEISGVGRTHYCGAYWGYGFHEDGVVSALDVCQEFTELRAAI
jgi:predicted NAD/FAD-binding protein